ncbi:GNAT family N-acetyltransferase [Microbulbifer agarilyticus]
MSHLITRDLNPSLNDLTTLSDGIAKFTEKHIGPENRQELTFFARNQANSVVGGIKGSYGNYGWLWIDTLWVSDSVRGEGLGTQLLAAIEREAQRDGCRYAYLNTFSFSAAEFYKKLGYHVYAELDDFPEEHSVFCLKKKLISS